MYNFCKYRNCLFNIANYINESESDVRVIYKIFYLMYKKLRMCDKSSNKYILIKRILSEANVLHIFYIYFKD